MKYLDKLTNNILELSPEQVEKMKEKKLTRRYVPYVEPAKEEEIKPGNITKPQIIIPKNKLRGGKQN